MNGEKNAQRSQPLVAKFGVDTAENKPSKLWLTYLRRNSSKEKLWFVKPGTWIIFSAYLRAALDSATPAALAAGLWIEQNINATSNPNRSNSKPLRNHMPFSNCLKIEGVRGWTAWIRMKIPNCQIYCYYLRACACPPPHLL